MDERQQEEIHEAVNAALDELATHLDGTGDVGASTSPCVRDIARAAGMSEFPFIAQSQESVGEPLGRYTAHVPLEHAAMRLAHEPGQMAARPVESDAGQRLAVLAIAPPR